MDDDELQTQVANAEAGNTGEADENTDFQESGDRGDSFDDDSQDDDQGNEDQGNNQGSQQGTDDLDDDDDDDDTDYLPPVAAGAASEYTAPQPFDIRTLRDADGSIDPVKANQMIQDYARKHGEQMVNQFANQNDNVSQTAQQLTTQWQKGVQKFPAVAKNKTLVKLARDIHLNSIPAARNGTGKYYSPVAAMKKVAAMQAKIAKGGYDSAKTRRTVVKTGQSEQGGGKGNGSKPVGEYQKARIMAQSSDPNVAKQGRMKVMELRRQAREK